MDFARFAGPPTELSDDKETNPKPNSNRASSDEWDIEKKRRPCSDRRYRSPTPTAHKQDCSEFCPKVLVPVCKKYQKAVNHQPYRFTVKLQLYSDVLLSEI